MLPPRLKFNVRMRPASCPEPEMVAPPPSVCVGMFSELPLTVPVHVSAPSLKTIVLMPAALFVMVMFTVPFTPGHESVPLYWPMNFARTSVAQVAPSYPVAHEHAPLLQLPPFKQTTLSHGSASSFLQEEIRLTVKRPRAIERLESLMG